MIIETLKKIILDFQEMPLEIGIPRRLKITQVPKKATICIGVRRSGKSTYMYQTIQKLLDSGVSQQNILYLNFFDDRLHDLQFAGLEVILEAYYSLFPDKKNSETVYCFFDEIQLISRWEPFVDRLMRTEKCEVFITGSSAHMLSKEIATQMRGRALSWEIFPFSFKEFMDFRGIDSGSPLSSKKQLQIRKAFEEYWEAGGFPEVAKVDKNLRIKIHQEYFNAMLFRDLIERHDISHPKAVMSLAHKLVDNIAAPYSINSLTGYLHTLGYKAPKSAVSDYLSWFDDAYILFSVHIFNASIAKTQTNPKKIYCIDHSLVTSVSSGILVNSGRLLENLVFIALRRVYPKIYYYKSKNGREVDFIVQDGSRSRFLIQVCESLTDPQTRKREIEALNEAMSELGITTATIVTRNEDEKIKTPIGVINVLAAWRFLYGDQTNLEIG